MTKTEAIEYLKEIDEYFRIHGWCTQTNVKITRFMALLDSGSMKYVKDWAYVTLRKLNIKNPTRILSIIFLKLLNVPDRELIRLLYTFLYGKLTFEDFNSLNTYIFKGKPPISKDLFYNITERVFIDKKSALQKALSISSIITRADPELTIFYMTMLLCRVDLNNENKAMLNLLIYCIDADIPEEVSRGVREYLLSIVDILEDIFKEPENEEFAGVLDAIHTPREEKIASPAFIPFEVQREESSSDNFGKSLVNRKSSVNTDNRKNSANRKSPVNRKSSTNNIKNSADKNNTSTIGNVSGNLTDDSESVFSEKGLQQSQSVQEVLPAVNGSVKVKKNYVNSNGPEEDTIAESNPGNSIKDPEVLVPLAGSASLKNTVLNKNNELLLDQKTGPNGKSSTGEVTNSLPESVDVALPKDSAETESSISASYELKMKTFKLSDLLFWGRGEKEKTGVKKPDEISKKEKQSPGRRITVNSFFGKNIRVAIYVLLAAAVIAGWFLLKPGRNVRQPVASGSEKIHSVNGQAGTTRQSGFTGSRETGRQIPSVQPLAGKEEVPGPDASEAGFQNKGPNDGVSAPRTIPGTEKEWNIRKTGRGIEWTVQKGESVWKLYIYLNGHNADFTGALKRAAQKDWLPFIHQIIKLNPTKNFAEPIEPGERFLVTSK